MKLRSVRYLTATGFRNIWANRLMSLASVGVLVACMSLIGVAVMLQQNVNKAVAEVEKENVVMVYFNDRNSVLYGESASSPEEGSPPGSGEDSGGSGGVSGETAGGSGETAGGSSGGVSSGVSGETSTAPGEVSAPGSGEVSPVAPGEGVPGDGNASSEPEDGIPEDSYLIHNEEEALALCEKLEKIPNVASVEFVPKEEMLDAVKENMLEGQAEYFDFIDDENPLSDGAKITVADLSRFDETVAAIRSTAGVDSVLSQESVADTVFTVEKALGIAGFWIIGILIVISLVIVSNTIRVTMYNRRLEISIMKAVGATDAFVRLPFLVEGVAIGIISGVVAMGLDFLLYKAVVGTLSGILGLSAAVPFGEFWWILAALFLIVGIGAGVLGSVIIIGRYLRKEGSELDAL